MHIYIYDSYLSLKKHEAAIARIETRITDLGLNGKIIRLGVMNSIYNAVEDELKKGAKTIITVGDIKILNQATNAMAHYFRHSHIGREVPLGHIGVGKTQNVIGQVLGSGLEEDACDTIAARRIKKIDLGLANDTYFLTKAQITTDKTSVEIDTNYSIEISKRGEIAIVNIPTNLDLPEEAKPKADDNILELFIKTQKGKKFLPLGPEKLDSSVFSFKKLLISNPEKGVLLDESLILPTPVEISIAKEKINLIVGKDRMF